MTGKEDNTNYEKPQIKREGKLKPDFGVAGHAIKKTRLNAKVKINPRGKPDKKLECSLIGIRKESQLVYLDNVGIKYKPIDSPYGHS